MNDYPYFTYLNTNFGCLLPSATFFVATQVPNKDASVMLTRGNWVDFSTFFFFFLISSLALCIYYILDSEDYFSPFYVCRKLPQD